MSITRCIGLLVSLLLSQPTTQHEWREKFDAAYGLAPDQVLKHIQPPFIDERLEFYASTIPEQAALIPAGPNVMMIAWSGEPQFWMCRFAGPEDGMPFLELLAKITGLQSFELDVAPELATQELKGDWALRKNTDPVKLLAQFAAIVGAETNQKIVVTREIVEQDSIVATGLVRFEDPKTPKKILLPLNEIPLRQPMQGFGQRKQFYEQLAESTGYPVVDDNSSDPPGVGFEWGADGDLNPPGREQDRVSPENLDALLKTISEQTRVTFTIESRKITRWRVSFEK